MKDINLVIGGTGFLGYYMLQELAARGEKIRSFGIDRPVPGSEVPTAEYVVGDVFSEEDLNRAMADVKTVYCFISTSMPNSGEKNLRREIDLTLRAHDAILTAMVHNGVDTIVFPSSGGAIYGDSGEEPVREDAPLEPSTAYGVGKQMCEELLGFYNRRFGVNTLIFRIGNVYGSRLYRRVEQGVIDVFTQAALSGETIKVWGDAVHSIRDYIYLDDAARAIVECTRKGLHGFHVFNVGSGKGTSVAQIISILEAQLGRRLAIEYQPLKSSGVSRIVLDTEKLRRVIGKIVTVGLEEGVARTIRAKKALLEKAGSRER